VPATPVQVLLLSGPGGVGKSTLGWEVATQLRRLGIATNAAGAGGAPVGGPA
jgi:adenylylsulfate kinase-like enzyme